MIAYIRSHIGLKLFLSYFGVILVCVVILAVAVNLAIPKVFSRHLMGMVEGGSLMGQMMQPGSGYGPGGPSMMAGLFDSFRIAVREALMIAALAACLVAALASVLIARQVVAPVQAMQQASLRIADGSYSERVAVSSGVSPTQLDELGKLAYSFNKMAEKLESTELMRRELIGDVSHELRTPLAAIKGSMEAMIDGVLPSDIETFDVIYREAERLEHLVNDLQELSRVEAGSYELAIRPCRVDSIVLSAVLILERQFEEKGVRLENEIVESLPLVLADEQRIGQVLINLLGNALQYTPSGGRVSVSAFSKDKEVWISVRDSGGGIAKEHIEHIFDRFYRVDKSRSRVGGGSGIGLTIARYLVEAQGGRIWAESPGVGQGSKFIFSLPAAT